MIAAMTKEHLAGVARLHRDSVPGLLQRLGEAATLAYYRGALASGLAVGHVYLHENAVAGFVFGSVHPDRLKRAVLRADPIGVLGGLVAGVLTRPSSLVWLLESLSGPESGAYDQGVPELTYLATDAARRGQGIGTQLVEAFNANMRERGASAYELSVDDDNTAGVGFYEKLGFKLVGRYREFGTQHRRYRNDLAATPGGRA